MGFRRKAEIVLYPVAFAAGIIAGLAIKSTGKRAAEIATCEAAMKEEFPAAAAEEAAEDFPAVEAEEAAEDFPAAEAESTAEEFPVAEVEDLE